MLSSNDLTPPKCDKGFIQLKALDENLGPSIECICLQGYIDRFCQLMGVASMPYTLSLALCKIQKSLPRSDFHTSLAALYSLIMIQSDDHFLFAQERDLMVARGSLRCIEANKPALRNITNQPQSALVRGSYRELSLEERKTIDKMLDRLLYIETDMSKSDQQQYVKLEAILIETFQPLEILFDDSEANYYSPSQELTSMHYAVNSTLDHQPAFDVVKRIAQKLKLTLNDIQLAFFIHMGLRHYSLDLSLQQPPPSYSLRVSVEQKDHIEQTIAQTTSLIDTISSKWDSLCSSRKIVQSCIQDVYDTTSKNDEKYLSEQTALQIFTEYWYEISDMPLDKSVEIVLFENQPTANFLLMAKGHLAIRKGRRITKKMVNRPLKLDTQKWIDANLQLFHKLLCDCPKAEHNIQAALFILYTGYHPFLDAKMPACLLEKMRKRPYFKSIFLILDQLFSWEQRKQTSPFLGDLCLYGGLIPEQRSIVKEWFKTCPQDLDILKKQLNSVSGSFTRENIKEKGLTHGVLKHISNEQDISAYNDLLRAYTLFFESPQLQPAVLKTGFDFLRQCIDWSTTQLSTMHIKRSHLPNIQNACLELVLIRDVKKNALDSLFALKARLIALFREM